MSFDWDLLEAAINKMLYDSGDVFGCPSLYLW